MANKPRWNDDFSSDPFSDPAYSINSGATGWTYNASTDRLENTTGAAVAAFATLLDSKHQSGIVEADLQYFYSTGSNNTAIAIRAFGYWFVVGELTSSKYIAVASEDVPLATVASSTDQNNLQIKIMALTGAFTMKIVGTPISVDFYIDDQIEFSIPSKVVTSDISAQLYRSGGSSGGTIFVSRLSIKADASLPLTPTVITPGLAGALPASDGPVIVQVPESRLYLDLGAFAGRIGIGGLTNVFYDPSGANVAMAEDVGIPDGLGGTAGDYYLESPVRGVSSDDRLVIKEEFVTANSVVVTDDIDFDIVDGPTGQNGTIVEEDDLHCYIEKYTNPTTSRNPVKGFIENSGNVVLHNINADGNDSFINGPARTTFVDDIFGSTLRWSSPGPTLPFIIDFDLLKIRKITKISWINTGLTLGYAISADIYSKTTPFSGASLGQGTLESNDYYGQIANQQTTTYEQYKLLSNEVPAALLDITTRYLRLVFNSDNFANLGAGSYTLGSEIFFFEDEQIDSINSDDDNAQFEFSNGGPYGAFPAGGVTQDSGNVRITLPVSMEHDGSSPNYYKVYFKPDITD